MKQKSQEFHFCFKLIFCCFDNSIVGEINLNNVLIG